MRWAVQADYFARRIATNDLTGIAGPHENTSGLADARRGLGA
jgi:homoserine kinase type II